MNKETANKLVKNTETGKIKTPGFFSNYKKWREEHGLNTPEFNAYIKAIKRDVLIIFVLGYVLGVTMYKMFGG